MKKNGGDQMDTLKILVVDDESRMRKLVKDFLTKKNFQVLEAGDGEEAMDIFYEEKDIALIILDVMMPKMDGWEVCREIRKNSKVPIIMLTARSDERDELLGFDLGVDEYISKPFSPKILVARVEAILRRTGQNNPEDVNAGVRKVAFARELFIERDDFMEDAPKKFFRLTPGQEVRLKNAYIVKCTGCKKDENGVITEVYCEYDANTRSGMPDANRKVKGTLHWVSCNHCLQAEVRLYDRLWKVENPRDELAAIREAKNCEALEAMKEIINPDSLKVLPNCYIEKFAATLPVLSYLQFQRIGYFNIDKDSTPEKLVFNRTVGLKDTWGKINK